MKECVFQDQLVAYLRAKGVWVKCLVGTSLQAGLPDIMCRSKHGTVFFVENKVWRNVHPPFTPDQFTSLLKGPQILVITQEMWGYGVYCPILALWSKDNVTAFYYDGVDILTDSWRKIADRLAEVTDEQTIHHRSVRSHQFNHHLPAGSFERAVQRVPRVL